MKQPDYDRDPMEIYCDAYIKHQKTDNPKDVRNLALLMTLGVVTILSAILLPAEAFFWILFFNGVVFLFLCSSIVLRLGGWLVDETLDREAVFKASQEWKKKHGIKE